MISSSLNQLANVHNQFQGSAKRALCVCSAGLLRSPTIASVLHKKYGWNVRCAGAVDSFALIPVSEALLEWAQVVVYAEPVHKQLVGAIDNTHYDEIVLNIPDNFRYNDPELIAIIEQQLEEHGVS